MISFSVTASSAISPESLCENIFDAGQWSSFRGYGPIPGIARVSKDSSGDSELGTVFHVENLDGSSHDEEVIEYIPGQLIKMHMHNFSAPLDRLASHFTERWDFQHLDNKTVITRSMELHEKNILGGILLRIISVFLKKALKRHTEFIASGS
ncbi:MAG: hypothetical protein CMQ38_08335 [Gammaproteobacteria bacterium]|nr:hypothetical protein [Gammaproteobacteria bacterium]|tara:strand:+ start:245 stop:700 length:456 start_codon:yes stop_codon:yes gene_type:complete